MEKILLGLLFIALGAFAVSAAAFSWVRTRRFVAESVSTPGEVVALSERRGRRVMYAPVVRFTGPDGRAVEFTDEVSRNPPGYRVGDRVHVMYRRRDPGSARVISPYSLYAFEIVFAGFGALFVGVGCLLVYLHVFG
jgi:hypothetical protein